MLVDTVPKNCWCREKSRISLGCAEGRLVVVYYTVVRATSGAEFGNPLQTQNIKVGMGIFKCQRYNIDRDDPCEKMIVINLMQRLATARSSNIYMN